MKTKATSTIPPDYFQYKGNDPLIKLIERILQRLDEWEKVLGRKEKE